MCYMVFGILSDDTIILSISEYEILQFFDNNTEKLKKKANIFLILNTNTERILN